MVLASIADNDVFQVGYPLLTIPLAAWYGQVTERRVAAAPALQVQIFPPQPQPQPPLPPRTETRIIRETTIIREGSETSDEDWWVAPVGIFFAGLIATFLLARAYASARDTLLDILLIGGVLALGLTLGTFLGLRGLPTFRGKFRAALVAAMVAEVLCVSNAYLLTHPSWTHGNYEQAFGSFLHFGTTLSDAFSDQQSDVTWFLAYQGLGAFIAILALVLGCLCAFAISGRVESDAGGHIGYARRAIVWALKWLGGGETLAWWTLVAAVLALALCSGVLYNLAGRSSFEQASAAPVVSSLKVSHGTKKVTASFTLDERATITARVRPVRQGRAGRALSVVKKEKGAGEQRISMAARKDGRALRAGRYRVEVTATDGDGDVSPPETAGFRVK